MNSCLGEAEFHDHETVKPQGWLTLHRNVAFNIMKEKTMSDMLKALSNMYEKPSTMNIF